MEPIKQSPIWKVIVGGLIYSTVALPAFVLLFSWTLMILVWVTGSLEGAFAIVGIVIAASVIRVAVIWTNRRDNAHGKSSAPPDSNG